MSYFQPFKDKTNLAYIIKGERGGIVPEELQGKYTKKSFAEQAIKAYENKKAKNDTSVQTGTVTRRSKPNRTSRKATSSGDGQKTS